MSQPFKYKHLFFDLDHTLWDFDANSEETLRELFATYQLDRHFSSFDDFSERYHHHNHQLWALYRKHGIDKKSLNLQRFLLPFKEVGFDDELIAAEFAAEYIRISPTKTRLFPSALEVLDRLKPHYTMHIITNGFREVQSVKLKNAGLSPYFSNVYISEVIGVQKPHPYFFEYSIKSCNARKKESLVIGDSIEADIEGAMKAGIDQVFFNPKNVEPAPAATYTISNLNELIGILL